MQILQIRGLLNNGFKLFKEQAHLLAYQFPELKYFEDGNGIPEVAGSLILSDDQGMVIDTYQIRIVCTPDYPLSFPLVYETGGRIPVNIEWHVYPEGHACICSIPDQIIACNKGITLGDFIDRQVNPYFFNQKHRELHGFFLKERSHGDQGNIEFFIEIFQTNDLQIIAQKLLYIKSNPEPNRVAACFCGSGKKYRHCHRHVFKLFKHLPGNILELFIRFILSCENGANIKT